jgi:hypothetical protein
MKSTGNEFGQLRGPSLFSTEYLEAAPIASLIVAYCELGFCDGDHGCL